MRVLRKVKYGKNEWSLFIVFFDLISIVKTQKQHICDDQDFISYTDEINEILINNLLIVCQIHCIPFTFDK
jgi:hypothetical protein